MSHTCPTEVKRTAICSACGYPTLAMGLCAVCTAMVAAGEADLSPAALQSLSPAA
jgi:hypothetical protein